MFLGARNLLQNKTRLVLSVAVVALSTMLILVLNGFLAGVSTQAAAYLDHAPGSLVVNREGRATSLPASALTEVSRVEGVAGVVPILTQTFIVDLKDNKLVLNVIGYDPLFGGGPWKLAGGRNPQSANEIVLDAALASQFKIKTGDRLEIGGRQFSITGLSEETSTWAYSYLFMSKKDLETLLLAPGAISFLLVTPDSEVSSQTLKQRLSTLPGLEVSDKSDLIADNAELLSGIYGPPTRMMIGIAFLVGALVVGLVIYTTVLERRREYGVLKAIGTGNGLLYRVVVIQALISAGAGALLGAGLAVGISSLIMALRPAFTITIERGGIALGLGAALAMALLAALFPIRALTRLAPADVFRR